MAHIFGIGPSHASEGVQPVGKLQPGNRMAQASGVNDTVEISMAAKLAAAVKETSMVRTDLVERVKNEIEAGVYETPERIDATVDRLMDELFGSI